MTIGVLCFPAGWDNDHVRGICGSESEDYRLGNCGVRWAFVLAAVAILDAWILGCLAFTLSHRHAKPIYSHQESPYMNPGSIYKGKPLLDPLLIEDELFRAAGVLSPSTMFCFV